MKFIRLGVPYVYSVNVRGIEYINKDYIRYEEKQNKSNINIIDKEKNNQEKNELNY
jgi:hypothetical protein